MTTPSLLLLALLASAPALAGGADCKGLQRSPEDALNVLGNPDREYDLRSRAGTCLVRGHLDQNEVNRVVLGILRDPGEDVLLKEDLIDALAEANHRRKVKVEGHLAPALGPQEREAVDRALSGVGSLLAAANAVKTIEEIVPVSRFEPDFFRVLTDIALDDGGHVLLRASAVAALERLSVKIYASGVYDEKSIKLVRETLRTVASRDDNASYFTNAGATYNRLAVAGVPGYSRDLSIAGTTRMLSSVKGANQTAP